MVEYKIVVGLVLNILVNSRLVTAKKSINNMDKDRYSDCQKLNNAGYKESGIYTLWHPINNTQISVQTECQMQGNFGYTVIQRRMYGNVNFNVDFLNYQRGFGHSLGDMWLGLNSIYYLTQTGNNVLTIHMQDWQGNNRNARYAYFKITDSVHYYLNIGRFDSSDVFDDLSYNNGFPFATYDKPDPNNCAINQKSGWWFNYCSYALPNGIYYIGGHYQPSSGYYDGIYWKDWLGYGYSLKFFSMTLSFH